jgi:hypothetical protein
MNRCATLVASVRGGVDNALRWHIENPTMSISLNLDEEQSARLEERARELGVDARELAKAAVNDLLTRPADDFDRAATFVLEKNRELYRRLS